MGFLIVAGSCIVGLIVGAMVGSDSTAGFGFFAGIAIGLVLVRLRTLSARIETLRRDVDAFRSARAGAPVVQPRREQPPISAGAAPTVDFDASTRPTPPAPKPIIGAAPARAQAATPTTAVPTPPPIPPAARAPTPPAPTEPPQPGAFDNATNAIKRWFTEGNVPVKVGMLVLIAGVAALLKYASDQGWLRLPIEFRLAGIALAAMAALAFGWRERERKRAFGLSLQGGALGLLLMTVFAAFRLYQLLPATAAFALMLVIVAGTGVLAVLQDALALAVLGILAGFAAPILISTGSGNHVVLFSYYALLNIAIFAIAWSKAWRVLNLLGFAFTYLIGTAWGVLSYRPELFSTTEPFLLIYFAIYLAIPILYARKRAPQRRDVVDGSLVFGNPLIAFALQAALLEGERMPLAYSALVLALVYAALAWMLVRRDGMRVLGESFAVLAVGFATLAVPLALSARATGCTFALEGAALVWLGFRQQRRLPRWSGLALQLLAAGAFLASIAFDAARYDTMPIANGGFITAVLIAGAALVSAWLHVRAGANRQLALLLYLWGLAWWLGAGLREIDRFVPAILHPQALLGFAVLSGGLAALAYRWMRQNALAWTAALALAAGIALTFVFAAANVRPFAGWALVAFAAYAVVGALILRELRNAPTTVLRVAHPGWIWTWTFAIALALYRFARDAELADGWADAVTLLPLLAAWMLTLLRREWIAPPLVARFDSYRNLIMGSQALLGVTAFTLLLLHDGDTAPLPFVPLLNPIELVQLAILACTFRWLTDPNTLSDLAMRRVPLLVIAAFAFVTAATLRGVHHFGNVPWDENIGSSMVAQTALTVVWSVLGVVGWVAGSRRGNRALWLAGAALMGVVLAKLLLVDRTHLGSGFGIASFIAYGLLCTVIGYFAPAPPRSKDSPKEKANGETA
jgi:uncharacterized membrane protein